MELRTQIKKLSLWIFLIPFVAINLCLFISVNYQIFDNTFLSVDMIGRSGPTFPYFDGGVSISRTARTYPTYLIFKPAMISASILLIIYWTKTNKVINLYLNSENKKNLFKTFGILSAIFLIIHSLFLGIKFDVDAYKLFRRVIMLAFIIFEIAAQTYFVLIFYSIKSKLKSFINETYLKCKAVLVSILIFVGILALPLVSMPGNKHLKHALEWDYFLGVITFYIFTFLLWKKKSN